jgi:hypothetical protein
MAEQGRPAVLPQWELLRRARLEHAALPAQPARLLVLRQQVLPVSLPQPVGLRAVRQLARVHAAQLEQSVR